MGTWRDTRDEVAELVVGLDPSAMSVADCVALLPVATEIANMAAAAVALLGGRIAESDRWRASGAKTAAEDHARRTGTGVSAARDALAAAAAMKESERLRTAAL